MIDLAHILQREVARPRDGASLRHRLADVLRRAVLDGTLEGGAVLPASRVLASELGIGRNTVLHAYEQLTAEGYTHADRQGTVVRQVTLPAAPRGTPAAVSLPPLAKRAPSPGPAAPWGQDNRMRPLQPGLPALDRFPVDRWRRHVMQTWSKVSATILTRGDVAGEMVLRAAIAGYLRASRGVRCDAEQVVITSGTQESLGLCANLLADPGELVWVEHPAYPGAIAAMSGAGLRLLPVPVDAEGLAPTPALWRRRPPRMIYITPSHQYPLGVTMSLSRRLALLDYARTHGSWIIEDDYDSEFCRSEPLAALHGLAPQAPVVYLGTFSKTMYPALRLGYAVFPEALVPELPRALSRRLSPGRAVEQEALASFIHEGQFTAHLRRMRSLYAERHAALRSALCPLLLSLPAALSGGAGGMHLTMTLPESVADREVVRRAHVLGIGPAALSCYTVPGAKPLNGLVLGYANVPAEHAGEQINKLAEALGRDG